MSHPHISVVIPTYKSDKNLPPLFEELEKTFSKLGTQCELVFVEDGSPGKTWEVLQILCRRYEGRLTCRSLRLDTNVGQHIATLTGFRLAKGHLIATMDDDLQVHPRFILRMVTHASQTGADLVYGNYENGRVSLLQQMGANCLKFLLDLPFASSFRLIKRELLDKIFLLKTAYPNVDSLLYELCPQISSVPVERQERKLSPSSYSFVKKIRLAVCLLSYLVLPKHTRIPMRKRKLNHFLPNKEAMSIDESPKVSVGREKTLHRIPQESPWHKQTKPHGY